MITAGGLLAIGEGPDVTALREFQRSMVALYVGGMGAKGKNFYNELADSLRLREGSRSDPGPVSRRVRRRKPRRPCRQEFLELTTLCGSDWLREGPHRGL